MRQDVAGWRATRASCVLFSGTEASSAGSGLVIVKAAEVVQACVRHGFLAYIVVVCVCVSKTQ